MKSNKNVTAKSARHGKRLEKYRNSRFYSLMYDKGLLYFVISFLIPAVIMTLAFRKNNIHPFGDKQMLVVDLWHQYYPFFRVVREKLLTGGSFFYSWQNGMGTNFLSLISYYAASPLNLLSVFFSEDRVRDALTFILIAKIGFAGSFFSCFLRYTFKRKDFSICIFATLFALCSYMLGYYWNVMWFDTIALFPLVMMGIVAICREGKWKTFTIALALSLISNYYIGYFSCIFAVFMFLAAIILNARGVKDFFGKLWIMFRSSVLGIALGGFILLPAYYGLQLTYSVNNVFPTDMSFYEKWTDIFANMISYSEPSMKEGLPNFACGMLAIVLFGVFLFSAGIKIREKISALLMLALIAVSCNMNILNYIWHGFHFTNMIPYRFAFIFSFVLLAAAYRAYDVILTNGVKIYQIIAMLGFPWVIFYLNYMISEGETFTLTEPLKNSLIICGAFILIFIAVKVFPFTNPKVRNTILSICVGAAVISECASNAAMGVKTVGSSDYNSYPTKYDEIEHLLDNAKQADDSLFYRTEVTKTYTLNDSALYGYYGVSQFSSAANVSVTRFCKKLGLYASDAGNRYYYRISTPVVNTMFGIKYLISKDGMLNSEEMALSSFDSDSNTYMYKNNYPLSLGYMISDDILTLEDITYDNPFEFQNTVMKSCTGVEKPCFTAQVVKYAAYDNMDVTKQGYGDYSFTVSEGSSANSRYTFDGVEGSYLYGYASNGGCDKINVTSEGMLVDSGIGIDDYPVVFPMGNAQEGETVDVEIIPKSDTTTGSFKLMVYALSQSAFEEAYSVLADEQLEITEFSDTKIKGKITALEDGVLFLSMPYEKGWSVYVDGEKTETCKVMNAMLGAKVPAGIHDIKIVYVPEGFAVGAAATCASAVICVVIAIFDRKRRKKKSEEQENTVAVTEMESVTVPEPENIIENEEPLVEETTEDSEEVKDCLW